MRALRASLLAVLLGATPLLADSDFQVQERKIEAPETGQFIVCQVLVGKEKYSFVPPRNWNVRAEAERRRVVLRCLDSTASMVITFSDGPTLDLQESNRAAVREMVLRRFAPAKILEEFSCYTSSEQGRGFQVAWKAGEVEMVSRVAIFPVKSGNLDFTLTTVAARIGTVQPAFGAVLTSFQRQSLNGQAGR